MGMGIKMRISSSFALPVGQFDKNHFGSASQQVCELRLESKFELELSSSLGLEFHSFMVTFAIIITIMCRVQWQRHFYCLSWIFVVAVVVVWRFLQAARRHINGLSTWRSCAVSLPHTTRSSGNPGDYANTKIWSKT